MVLLMSRMQKSTFFSLLLSLTILTTSKFFTPLLSLSLLIFLSSPLLVFSLLSSSKSAWGAVGGDADEEAGHWVRRQVDGKGATAGGALERAGSTALRCGCGLRDGGW